jgi:hypothetical protein
MAETWKLAAILAADVAGYSKLAAADEERTGVAKFFLGNDEEAMRRLLPIAANWAKPRSPQMWG